MNHNLPKQQNCEYAYAIYGAPKRDSRPLLGGAVVFMVGVVVGILIAQII